MKKIELICLFGINGDFEERTPSDLNNINSKTFSIKFDKLSSANEFKHIWENSKDMLENILANKNSKKGFSNAKKLLIDNHFEEQKKRLEEHLEKSNKIKLKSRK